MNILVTGAKGQLGKCIQEYVHTSDLLKKFQHISFIFTDYDELDITSYTEVSDLILRDFIDVVINCAAYTNVDKAEDDYDNASLINTIGCKNLANACRLRNALLIHISTDYVFGKQEYNIPCTEDMVGEPTGVYGLTKLDGENEIINSNCKYVILRTSWLYSEYGNNFVKTMINLQNNKDQLKVIFDQIGTPTNAHDLTKAIINIIIDYHNDCNKFDKYGIYNFSNEGVCSWYDFAIFIKKLANTNCKIIPCHSNEFPSKVKRPNYSVLDKTKIKETFNIEIPYWYDSLVSTINTLISNITDKKI